MNIIKTFLIGMARVTLVVILVVPKIPVLIILMGCAIGGHEEAEEYGRKFILWPFGEI